MTSKTTRPRFSAILSLSVVAMLTTGGMLYAGPLDPPAGPIVSTGKTLTEVEPRIAINQINTPGTANATFRITQPGSYYLTSNLVGEVGKSGIEVSVVGGTLNGGVTIDLNGFEIRGTGTAGGGSGDGIRMTVFENNLIIRNGTVRGWAGDGIDLTAVLAPSCIITDICSKQNGLAGVSTSTSTSITKCVFSENGGIGLATSSGCVITASVASSNGQDGFLLGSGSTITGCTAYLNTGDGIRVNLGCTVSDCTSYANTGDGIEASVGSVITNNTCRTNGFNAGNGAGIHITGEDNRVEGNNCAAADRGIDVDVAGNFITRNTCAGNTVNWDVVAGNVILVVNAATAGAVTGNAGGTAPGSTDPNANFSY
ncbi:MAG: right-handed parallel beta-helix repeat-containing protein [Phycisphaerales bacterium]